MMCLRLSVPILGRVTRSFEYFREAAHRRAPCKAVHLENC
jgi:hypothetical protein